MLEKISRYVRGKANPTKRWWKTGKIVKGRDWKRVRRLCSRMTRHFTTPNDLESCLQTFYHRLSLKHFVSLRHQLNFCPPSSQFFSTIFIFFIQPNQPSPHKLFTLLPFIDFLLPQKNLESTFGCISISNSAPEVKIISDICLLSSWISAHFCYPHK